MGVPPLHAPLIGTKLISNFGSYITVDSMLSRDFSTRYESAAREVVTIMAADPGRDWRTSELLAAMRKRSPRMSHEGTRMRLHRGLVTAGASFGVVKVSRGIYRLRNDVAVMAEIGSRVLRDAFTRVVTGRALATGQSVSGWGRGRSHSWVVWAKQGPPGLIAKMDRLAGPRGGPLPQALSDVVRATEGLVESYPHLAETLLLLNLDSILRRWPAVIFACPTQTRPDPSRIDGESLLMFGLQDPVETAQVGPRVRKTPPPAGGGMRGTREEPTRASGGLPRLGPSSLPTSTPLPASS